LTAVDLHEANVPRLFAAFLAGTLDALITVYNPDVMSETIGHGVLFEKIGEEEYVVIAPAKHPLARARAVTWETLASESWVLTRKPSLSRLFIEDSFLRHGLMCPAPVCETDSPRTSAQIVAQGVGLSSVPGITAQEAVSSGAARLVRVQTPQPRATLGLVYRTAAARHPRIKLLREAVSQISGLGLPIGW
jgi:LysR family transcriptional regulator of abg operon